VGRLELSHRSIIGRTAPSCDTPVRFVRRSQRSLNHRTPCLRRQSTRRGAQTHAVLASLLRTIQQRHLDAGAVVSQLLRSPKSITALAPPNSFPVESCANGRSQPR
jgi:hypothetical protein